MRVAFAIFKVFPHGGIARDLRKIAAECLARGHQVRIYAMQWEGEPLPGAERVLLPQRGVRSHVRQRRFAAAVLDHARWQPMDLLVGMNKMPELNVYFAGDSCFENKVRTQRPWLYRLTPRYHHFADFESAVFAVSARTRILAIAPAEVELFKAIYGTPAHRFHALPPGLERDRIALADAATAPCRKVLRAELGVGEGELLVLFVGSGFIKKGLDRVLRGVAALSSPLRQRVRLLVVGHDRPERFQLLARRLAIADRVRFLGGRDDVPTLLRAADAFVLPAYDEAAGIVILESVVAGVPTLATANCGYASYIEQARAGLVTALPFKQEQFNADLTRLLESDERSAWARRGRDLAKALDLHALAPCAVDLLERFAAGGETPSVAFCAYRYAPAKPKYRPLLPVMKACRERGMNVRVYAHTWQGGVPAGVELVRVPVAAMNDGKRVERYRGWVTEALRRVPDACVVGFERLPGINLYYGRTCQGQAGTQANGAERRLSDLPVGLTAAPPDHAGTVLPREECAGLRFDPDTVVFAMAGDDLASHGFERLLTGFGKLPDGLRQRCQLLALGELPDGFATVAKVLNLRQQVHVLPKSTTCQDLILAADVFVELAYVRSSSGWIFDAMTAGRAVVTHEWIEESGLVREADAGIVLAAPFRQSDCNRALVDLLDPADATARRERWQANAARFAANPAHYGHAAQAAELIAQQARRHGAVFA